MKKRFTSLIRSIGTGLAMAAMAFAPWQSASADVVTLNFSGWDFPGTWTGNSYVAQELTIEGYTVNMTASHQTTNITDCPVTKGSPITVTFPEGKSCSHVTLKLKQWTTKAQTVTLNTNTDGSTFTATTDKSSNFTLDADLDLDVKAIKFTFSSSSNQVGIESITLTEGGQQVDPAAPANPTITFDEATNLVTLNCTTEDAAIYYTLNGTEPTAASTLYSAPFTVSESCTIKAIAVKGGVSSLAVSKTVTVIPAAMSIAGMIEAAPAKNDKVRVGCDLTVVYKSGKYIYVIDSNGDAVCLYDNSYTNVTLNSGDVLPGGWIATNCLYNGLIEFNGDLPQPTGATGTFNIPEVETVTADDINHVVLIKNVTFEDATLANTSANFNATLSDGSDLQFRNNFLIPSTEAGTYNVKAAIGIFNSTLQAYPIEYFVPAASKLIISEPGARIGEVFPEATMTVTTYLGGEALTNGATITCPEGVTCNHTTLTAQELMAEDPVELVFTITVPSTPGEFTKTVTISSEGAESLTYEISGEVMNIPAYANAAQVMTLFRNGYEEWTNYLYTGEATVTFIEDASLDGYPVYYIYAQDETGALCFTSEFLSQKPALKVGDKITSALFWLQSYFGAPQLILVPIDDEEHCYTFVSENNPVTPTEVSLNEITSSNASDFIYRLLKVNGVHFQDTDGTFAANTNYYITDGTNTGVVRIFDNTNLIDTEIPAGNLTITGISGSMAQLTLKPRSTADIVDGDLLPELTIYPPFWSIGETFPGITMKQTVYIGGEHLSGGATITCPEGVTCDHTTLTAEELMAEDPVELVFSATMPTEVGEFSYDVTISSEGVEDLTFNISGEIIPIPVYNTAAELMGLFRGGNYEEGAYFYNGQAVVTHVDVVEDYGSNIYYIYAQDETGGFCVNSMWLDGQDVDLKVGDKITNIPFIMIDYFGPQLVGLAWDESYQFCEVISEGNTVAPLDVTLNEITADNAFDFIYRLLKVSGVQFQDTDGTFAANSNYNITDGTNTGVVRLFDNTNLIGTDLPTGIVNITGISGSMEQLTLKPRSTADIVEGALIPELSIYPPFWRIGEMFPGITMKQTVYIGGEHLSGGATITCPEGVTCDHTTLTAEELMAEDPVELVFSATLPTEVGEFSYDVTISSEGVEDLTFNISGEIIPISVYNSAAEIMGLFKEGDYEYDMYFYSGQAVVTHVDVVEEYGTNMYYIYAQDETGGLCINSMWLDGQDVDLKVGDKITNVPFMLIDNFGPQLIGVAWDENYQFCEVISEGNTVAPLDVTLNEITAANASDYIYRLLKVNGVHFQNTDGTFAANTNYNITDGTDTGVVRLFDNTNLIGTEIPAGNLNITGISGSMEQLTLKPRSTADIQERASDVVITRKLTFDFTNNAAPVGQETEIAQYTVEASNLPIPAPVLITGANADMFKAVPSEIPAGTATTIVKIIYTPTSVGIHKGGVMFDFDAINPEYNLTGQFSNCKAYDPENLPSITIEPAVIKIQTVPGQPVTATAVLKSTGTFDYITATRQGTGDNGGITINNTYLPAGSDDVVLTVTFTPKDKGDFTETWTYTTTMCETPATLTVNAKCSDSVPVEDPEGDNSLKADFANPYAWYTQDFASVEQNKPLSIDGWTNLAIDGTRAWWGYRGANGEDFTAAKVTAYDSAVKPGEGTNCQMALISPALDYKNATEKKLKFRLMGMYLNEDSGDTLEVKFGEQGEPDELGNPSVEFYEMTGFDIPTTADQAGEWIDYVVDMSVIEDMPDTFVICFEFTGTRGVDNTTTYYITDFEWGAEPSSVDTIVANGIAPDADGWYTLYNMQGIRVIRTRDAKDLKDLPAGIYIGNGRKYILK